MHNIEHVGVINTVFSIKSPYYLLSTKTKLDSKMTDAGCWNSFSQSWKIDAHIKQVSKYNSLYSAMWSEDSEI